MRRGCAAISRTSSTPADDRAGEVSFAGKYPADFLLPARRERLPVWHLVGGLDPIEEADLTGTEPHDGYPILLRDWIRTDGLRCLKIKLRGTDSGWDYERIVKIGRMAIEEGVTWLTADFNCTVTDPAYVTEILDRCSCKNRAFTGCCSISSSRSPTNSKRTASTCAR